MTIIKGKAFFKCPETGEEVALHKRCTNIDGEGNNCLHFRHWSWEGARPLLACHYPEYVRYEKDVKRRFHLGE